MPLGQFYAIDFYFQALKSAQLNILKTTLLEGPMLEFDSWYLLLVPFSWLCEVLVVAMLMFCITAIRLTGVLASTRRCAAQVQTLRIRLKLKKGYQIIRTCQLLTIKCCSLRVISKGPFNYYVIQFGPSLDPPLPPYNTKSYFGPPPRPPALYCIIIERI